MNSRFNVSLDEQTKKHLGTLKTTYEARLGSKLSMATIIRMAIFNALVSEELTNNNQAK